MPNLTFIGLPGCGKTYWGNKLAQHLAIPFHDLDQMIEKETGRKIAQIFAEHGEEHFRKLEHNMLTAFYKNNAVTNYILACGGGTPAFDNNMDIINSNSKAVFLDVSISNIIKQLTSDKQANRPLLKNGSTEQLEQLLCILRDKRLPSYTKASFSVTAQDINLDNLKEIYFYE